MARRKGTSIENNFVAGLVTEKTALAFPPNACTETYNCIFDEKGKITRRHGVDLETGYGKQAVTFDSTVTEAYTEFLWRSVAGNGDRNFLVVQKGSVIYFYDVSNTTTSISTSAKSFTINLNDYSVLDGVESNECQYTYGNGVLLVVNRCIDPIYIIYDADTDTVSVNATTVTYRDFTGIDDGLGVSERTTSGSISQLKTDNLAHYYNLLNQGWHQGGTNTSNSALELWAIARSDEPSNADYIGLYRSSETLSFDNARVSANTPGNTAAPKGHFILSLGSANREQAMSDDGFSVNSTPIVAADGTSFFLVSTVGSSPLISTTHTVTNSTAFLDTTTSQAAASATYIESLARDATSGHYGAAAGISLTSAKKIINAIVYPSNDLGFHSLVSGSGGGSGTTYVVMYAKQGAAPTHVRDGTWLGQTTISGDQLTSVTVTSTDAGTDWDHVWVYTYNTSYTAGSTKRTYFAEVTFTASVGANIIAADQTSERPSTIAFFAGRAWYAGLKDDKVANSIYFTQIIENEDQYGKCYQANDPTAEVYFDLLPSDGGVIRIPEAGNIKKMGAYYGALIVNANNGNWIIRGSGDGRGFTATDYRVERLPSIGTQSGLSFADINGLPIWWGENGIYMLEYNPQFDSFSIRTMSDETIKTFYTDIPALNRKYAKACYDMENQIVTWLYNNSETLAAEDYYNYNAALSFNVQSKAFYPWTFEESTAKIRGIVYCVDAQGLSDSKVKFVVSWNKDTDEEYLSLGEYSTEWSDWSQFATLEGTTDDEKDYSSYFITGYKWEGETQKFVQQNYIMVFLEQEDDAQAYVQGVFDTTSSGQTGKWSTRQYVYNDTLTNRNVNWRRLKIRGKGRSLQLRFTSITGKPFTILGWSVNQSVTEEL